MFQVVIMVLVRGGRGGRERERVGGGGGGGGGSSLQFPLDLHGNTSDSVGMKILSYQSMAALGFDCAKYKQLIDVSLLEICFIKQETFFPGQEFFARC